MGLVHSTPLHCDGPASACSGAYWLTCITQVGATSVLVDEADCQAGCNMLFKHAFHLHQFADARQQHTCEEEKRFARLIWDISNHFILCERLRLSNRTLQSRQVPAAALTSVWSLVQLSYCSTALASRNFSKKAVLPRRNRMYDLVHLQKSPCFRGLM